MVCSDLHRICINLVAPRAHSGGSAIKMTSLGAKKFVQGRPRNNWGLECLLLVSQESRRGKREDKRQETRGEKRKEKKRDKRGKEGLSSEDSKLKRSESSLYSRRPVRPTRSLGLARAVAVGLGRTTGFLNVANDDGYTPFFSFLFYCSL